MPPRRSPRKKAGKKATVYPNGAIETSFQLQPPRNPAARSTRRGRRQELQEQPPPPGPSQGLAPPPLPAPANVVSARPNPSLAIPPIENQAEQAHPPLPPNALGLSLDGQPNALFPTDPGRPNVPLPEPFALHQAVWNAQTRSPTPQFSFQYSATSGVGPPLDQLPQFQGQSPENFNDAIDLVSDTDSDQPGPNPILDVAPQALQATRAIPQNPLQSNQPAGNVKPRSIADLRNRPAGNVNLRNAADVWTFYEKVDNNLKAVCKFCMNLAKTQHHLVPASFSSTSSTSTLRNHLVLKHEALWVQACDRLKIPIKSQAGLAAAAKVRGARPEEQARVKFIPNQPFSKSSFVDAIVDFIVKEDLPINIIGSSQLIVIFKMLKSDLKDSDIPGRTTLRTRIDELLRIYLDYLIVEFQGVQGKISFTTDMWSDPNREPFMAVTAHWIVTKAEQTPAGVQYSLCLQAALIGFIRVPGHHTGEHLAHAFISVLDRIGIAEKIGWITTDNATNNDLLMETLADEFNRRKIKFNRYTQHIRCFPHVVNLAVKAVLAAMTKLEHGEEDSSDYDPPSRPATYLPLILERDPISIIRTFIATVRRSSILLNEFSIIQQRLNATKYQLIRDVKTRWSSVLLMLERVLLLKDPIRKLLASHEGASLQRYKLSNEEWTILADFHDILMVPHAFQQILSHEKTPTLRNALPAYAGIITRWEEYIDVHPEYSNVINLGLDKLESYEERTTLCPAYELAMILDPSIKLAWLIRNQPQRVPIAKQELMLQLRPIFNRLNERVTTGQDRCAPPATALNAQSKAHQLLGLHQESLLESQDLIVEVECYLNDRSASTSSLCFWQENQLRYPTLFMLSLDILPIQASSVPCERIFSSAKATMAPRRSRIKPDLMEALQLLKFSIRDGKELDFSQGGSAERELRELEELMEDSLHVPEDVNAFVAGLTADFRELQM